MATATGHGDPPLGGLGGPGGRVTSGCPAPHGSRRTSRPPAPGGAARRAASHPRTALTD
jgi:hypothetical protein